MEARYGVEARRGLKPPATGWKPLRGCCPGPQGLPFRSPAVLRPGVRYAQAPEPSPFRSQAMNGRVPFRPNGSATAQTPRWDSVSFVQFVAKKTGRPNSYLPVTNSITSHT